MRVGVKREGEEYVYVSEVGLGRVGSDWHCCYLFFSCVVMCSEKCLIGGRAGGDGGLQRCCGRDGGSGVV